MKRENILDKQIRDKITRAFPYWITFYRKAKLAEKELPVDAFYRVMRGEPCNNKEWGTVKNAWLFMSKRYLTGEQVEELLNICVEKAKEFTTMPLNRNDILNEIDKHIKLSDLIKDR